MGDKLTIDNIQLYTQKQIKVQEHHIYYSSTIHKLTLDTIQLYTQKQIKVQEHHMYYSSIIHKLTLDTIQLYTQKQIKVQEHHIYYSSIIHSLSSVFNNEHDSFPALSVKRSLNCRFRGNIFIFTYKRYHCVALSV